MLRFHVLGIEHTSVSKEYTNCAFTQKVLNMCKMLKMSGHHVILYGNEGSDESLADEFVPILKKEQLLPHIDIHKYKADGPEFQEFHTKCIQEIAARKQKNDFLLCPWLTHYPIAQVHQDMIVVESGIGYGGGTFAPFRVFESYAIMHATYGLEAVTKADKFKWYDRVIPNYFDPTDFTFNDQKDDYILFLGMRHGGIGKGYSVARDACRDAGVQLFVAGNDSPPASDIGVEYIGQIGVEERCKWLMNARALIAPSLYIEPFAGVQVEAFLSGTPVISTDWGAFTEYNIQGLTGYRCHTHGEFVNAISKAKDLNHGIIYQHGLTFTLDQVRLKYDAYWNDIMQIYNGAGGWYAL